MRTRYHASICKWIRGLATVFIAQHGIENYNGDVAIMDIIAINQDNLLVLIGLTIPQFLAVYKASNKLPFLPTPTVQCNFQNAIEQINGDSYDPPPPPPLPEDREDVIFIYNPNQKQIQDKEMLNAPDGIEQIVDIGGRTTQYQLITKVYIDCIVTPLKEFHAQLKRNAKTKRIKTAFTSAVLTETTECVANIIGHKPPAQQPVLWGLVDETKSKKTAAMEQQIQPLEDKLKASNIKAKKSTAMGQHRSVF